MGVRCCFAKLSAKTPESIRSKRQKNELQYIDLTYCFLNRYDYALRGCDRDLRGCDRDHRDYDRVQRRDQVPEG